MWAMAGNRARGGTIAHIGVGRAFSESLGFAGGVSSGISL